jgi:hypothetical protein
VKEKVGLVVKVASLYRMERTSCLCVCVRSCRGRKVTPIAWVPSVTCSQL